MLVITAYHLRPNKAAETVLNQLPEVLSTLIDHSMDVASQNGATPEITCRIFPCPPSCRNKDSWRAFARRLEWLLIEIEHRNL